MLDLFLFFLAVLPAVILFLLVYFGDRYEREPLGLLFSLVGLGVASTSVAMIFELRGSGALMILGLAFPFLEEGRFIYEVIDNFLIVALVEESGKLLVTFLRTWKNKNFDHTYDGVVYAVSASLGFALLENILYVFSNRIEAGIPGGLLNGLSRAFLAVPMHTGVAIFMGFFYGKAKAATYKGKKGQTFWLFVLSLAVPVLIHGMYDFMICYFTGLGYILFALFVVFLYIFTIIMGIYFAKHNKSFNGRLRVRVTKDKWLRYVITDEKEVIILGLTKPYNQPCLTIPNEIEGCPVRVIGRSAFAYTNLMDVKLPAGIREISDMAFFNCPYLREVILPNSIYRIGNYAFEYCYSMQRFLMPYVAMLGDHVFDGNNNLQDIYYLGGPEDWQRVNYNAMANQKIFAVRFYYHTLRR